MVPYLGFLLLQWNTMTNSKLRRKGFIYLTLQFPKKSQDRNSQVGAGGGTWRQELIAEATEEECQCCLLACLQVPLFSYRTRDGTAHNGLGFPLSVTEKISYSWISWKHFLSLSFLFSNNSSMYQVDIKLATQLYQIIHFCFLTCDLIHFLFTTPMKCSMVLTEGATHVYLGLALLLQGSLTLES